MAMTKKIRFPQDPQQPFQTGQVWELENSCLRIGVVGKTLVEYKRYKGKARGVPASFSSKRELEKYLTENKAMLLQE